MRADVLVYVSGPITPRDGFTVEENAQQAIRVFCDLLRRGIPAFCPHLTAGDEFGIAYDTWMAYDLAVIARCTHVLMLPRWQSSPGAVREHTRALDLAIPVVHSVATLERLLAWPQPPTPPLRSWPPDVPDEGEAD
jgi:hypothetical protein